MIAVLMLVVLLVILGAYVVTAAIDEWRARRDHQQAAALERLRMRHEQFVAERRLQQVVGDGLTRLLREARGDRD